MAEPESTTSTGNGLRAYEEKLLQMLLHFQFACPLIARTVSIISNIQNAPEPDCLYRF